MKNIAILLIAIPSILVLFYFLDVSGNKESKEYREFVKKYNSNTRTFCKDGFKMRETFLSPKAKAPQVYLINSQDCAL